MEKEVSVFVLGDFYPEQNIVENLNQFDASAESKDGISKDAAMADLCIVNLESPITNHHKAMSKTGPALKGDVAGLQFLKNFGCNLVTLANNHIMDYGRQGLQDTLEVLNKEAVDFLGAGMNLEEARKIKYYTINGIHIAILNFAENEWSTSTNSNDAGASPLDEISNFQDIAEARQKADKVIVITHGGHEMYNLPSPRMKKVFRFFIEAGADAVINHHTHCVSGYEVFKGKPILYSIGNFIFEDSKKADTDWNIGMGVRLVFSKTDLKFEVKYFKQCNGNALLQELNPKESDEIRSRTEAWNQIILSDAALQAEFDKWVQKNKNQYLSYIEPHNIRPLSSLQFRNWFPSLWSARKKKYLLNLIRCEAHRDVITSILKDADSHS